MRRCPFIFTGHFSGTYLRDCHVQQIAARSWLDSPLLRRPRTRLWLDNAMWRSVPAVTTGGPGLRSSRGNWKQKMAESHQKCKLKRKRSSVEELRPEPSSSSRGTEPSSPVTAGSSEAAPLSRNETDGWVGLSGQHERKNFHVHNWLKNSRCDVTGHLKMLKVFHKCIVLFGF